MIRPLDTITLAYTKIRARKVRTAITIIVSGLLFGILMAAVFITSGVLQSVEDFGKEGIGERYIVKTISVGNGGMSEDPFYNPEVVKRVEELHKNRIAEKKSEAKRLGIDYVSELEDPSPITTLQEDGNRKVVNFQSQGNKAVQQAVQEFTKKTSKPFDIRSATKGYDIKAYPELRVIQPADGQLEEMEDGKESIFVEKSEAENKQQSFMDQSENKTLRVIDSSITKPFTTAEFDPNSGSIPVLLPYAQAEKRLGLKPLDPSATKQQKIDRINEVRNRSGELIVDMCYRNSSSQELLGEAMRIDKEIRQKANDKDYQKPTITYTVPDASSCGAIIIKEDLRTTIQKDLDEKRAEFDRKFNGKVEPYQRKLKLQVIGMTPTLSISQSQTSIASAIAMMLSPSIDDYWSLPSELLNKLPADQRPDTIFGDHSKEQSSVFRSNENLVEFNSLESARKFLKDNECVFSCSTGIFSVPFGSSSLIVADVKFWIEQMLYWIVLVASVIAAIILTGMIGRTVADGRRETAVFRAIGARRSDITAIYTTYTLLLAVRIVVFSAVLGVALALVVNWWMSADATTTAQLTFGTTDTSKIFQFFGVESIYTLIIPGCVIAAALFAMIIPLLRNVRRNPIQDMRDE
jgi:hypothetical protein